MKKGYVNSNGIRIYYQDSEANLEPILFLHGNGEDHTYFKVLEDYFSSYYRIIYVDSRDHGLSDISNGELDFKLMSKDVYCVLENLNIKTIKVIGFSDGASIAMQFAMDHFEMVESLVLVGANYDVDGMKLETIKGIKQDLFRLSFLPLSLHNRISKKRLKLMLNHPHFTKEELESINIPVLNVFGDNDCIKKEHSQNLTEILNAKEIIFKNASHNLILEYPDIFFENVMSFFAYTSRTKYGQKDDVCLVKMDKQDYFLNYIDFKDEYVQKSLNECVSLNTLDGFISWFENRKNYLFNATILDCNNMKRIGNILVYLEKGRKFLEIRIFEKYRNLGYGNKALKLALNIFNIDLEYYRVFAKVYETADIVFKLLKSNNFVRTYEDKLCLSKINNCQINEYSYCLILAK